MSELSFELNKLVDYVLGGLWAQHTRWAKQIVGLKDRADLANQWIHQADWAGKPDELGGLVGVGESIKLAGSIGSLECPS